MTHKIEPQWVEIERMHARMYGDGERVEVLIERWGLEGASLSHRSEPHRVRAILDSPRALVLKYECEPHECNGLGEARARARRLLVLHSSRLLDGRKVICEASVEILGFENVPWPGPCYSDGFFLNVGGGPAIDREIAEMRRKREALERAGPFLPPPESAPKTRRSKRATT